MCDESFGKSARKVEFNLLSPPSLNRMGRKFCANCSANVLSEIRFFNLCLCFDVSHDEKDSLVYQGKKDAVLGHVS